MKLSDLINQAQGLKDSLGDLDVSIWIMEADLDFDVFHFNLLQNDKGEITKAMISEGEAEDNGEPEQ